MTCLQFNKYYNAKYNKSLIKLNGDTNESCLFINLNILSGITDTVN